MTGRTRGLAGIGALNRRGWTIAAVYALLGEPVQVKPILRWDTRQARSIEALPDFAERVRRVPRRGAPMVCLAEFGDITYRQLDYWVRQGYLKPSRPARGSGSHRGYPDSEKHVAVLMSRFIAAGLTVEAAHRAARLDGTCELAPGIWITVDES